MKNRKVLITGGEGFVGNHMINYLLNETDYEIVSTYFMESTFKEENNRVEFVKLDIRKQEDVENLLKIQKPDYIYHLAGISFVPASFANPLLTHETNFLGTYNLYESIRKLNLDTSILFVSTSEVYGQVDDNVINEERVLKPQNPYSVSKASAELLSYQYYKNYGLKIKIARPFNHIGVGQSENFVIPNFAKQIADINKNNKESTIEVGNLDAIRDFTDVKDIIRGYKCLVESDYNGETFNLCQGKGYSIKEILDILLSFSNKKIEVKFDEKRMRPSDNPNIVGNNKKIEKALHWKPIIDIRTTLYEVYNFYKNTEMKFLKE